MGRVVKRRLAKKQPIRKAKVDKKKIEASIANIDSVKPPTLQVARLFALLKSWLADESGYDEETLPQLRRALDRERDRVGARRLFDD